jgi:hypothetical protein
MNLDVEPLVREVLRRQWTLVCFGRRSQPDALAAVHRDQRWTDVVVLRYCAALTAPPPTAPSPDHATTRCEHPRSYGITLPMPNAHSVRC